MPQLLYLWEGDPVPIVEEAVWALRPGWMAGEEKISSHPHPPTHPPIPHRDSIRESSSL